MRRALEVSAHKLAGSNASDSILSQGHGLIDVVAAWDILISENERDVERGYSLPLIEVTVANGGAGAGDSNDKGIYWRDASQTHQATDVPITLSPIWNSTISPSVRASFSVTLALDVVYHTKPQHDWISTPTHISLSNASRSFTIHVDARSLPIGSVTVAEILVYEVFASDISASDAKAAGRVPIARVPITIIKPEVPPRDNTTNILSYTFRNDFVPSSSSSVNRLSLRAGTILRRFLDVPIGATWAQVVVTRHSAGGIDASSRVLVIHAAQVIRGTSGRGLNDDVHLRLAPGETDGASVEIRAGCATLEITVAQLWSSLGDTSLSVIVNFHGISSSTIAISQAEQNTKIVVTPLVGDVVLRPIGRLDEWTTFIEPQSGSTPKALSVERAAPPNGGTLQFSITFDYKLKVEKDEKNCSFGLPSLGSLIYDSSFDGILFTIHSHSNRLVAAGDVFGASNVNLLKGNYDIKAVVLGEESKLVALTKSSTGPLLSLSRRILDKDALALSITASHPHAANAPSPPLRLRQNQPASLWVAAPAPPKSCKPGDILSGFLLLDDIQPRHLLRADRAYTLGGDTASLIGRHPRGIRVTYSISVQAEQTSVVSATKGPTIVKQNNDDNIGTADDNKFADTLRDVLISRLRILPPLASPTGEGDELLPSTPLILGLVLPRACNGMNSFEALATSLLDAAQPGQQRLHILFTKVLSLDNAIIGKCWGNSLPPPIPLKLSYSLLVSAINAVISEADADGIARYAGLRHETPSIESKKWSEARTQLVTSLWCHCRVLCVATLTAASAGAKAASLLPLPITTKLGAIASPSSSVIDIATSTLPSLPIQIDLIDNSFSNAVNALAPWAAVSGTEGSYAPLIMLETALRANKWATALEILNNKTSTTPTTTTTMQSGLDGLHPLVISHLKVYCLLRLGLYYFAQRQAQHTTSSQTNIIAPEL